MGSPNINHTFRTGQLMPQDVAALNQLRDAVNRLRFLAAPPLFVDDGPGGVCFGLTTAPGITGFRTDGVYFFNTSTNTPNVAANSLSVITFDRSVGPKTGEAWVNPGAPLTQIILRPMVASDFFLTVGAKITLTLTAVGRVDMMLRAISTSSSVMAMDTVNLTAGELGKKVVLTATWTEVIGGFFPADILGGCFHFDVLISNLTAGQVNLSDAYADYGGFTANADGCRLWASAAYLKT
jgi:hypothetical protein